MPPRDSLLLAWLLLLGGVLTAPWVSHAPRPEETATRNTIRLALGFYFAAVGLMLARPPHPQPLSPRNGGRGGQEAARPAGSPLPLDSGGGGQEAGRLCWVLACATYLVHFAAAMHFYHGWSHARAMRHVEEGSGFGPGIFVTYLFTLVWVADAGWWLLAPASRARRPAWLGWAVHGFLAFILFNGAVVFVGGPVRWVSAVVFAALAARLFLRRPILQGNLS